MIKKYIISLLYISSLLLSPFIHAETYSEDHETVRKYLLNNTEGRVKKATWLYPNTIKLGVVDNGHSRSGFAEFTCVIFRQMGFKGKDVLVHIVDIEKFDIESNSETLGGAHCPANYKWYQ